MTPDEMLKVFHEQVRLADGDVHPGWQRDSDGPVRRSYPTDPAGPGRGMIEAPDGLGDDPDGVVAAQRAFFADRGQAVEWKTYGYDEPADLGDRLTAAGFESEGPEALILGEIDRILERPSSLSSRLRVRDVESPGDFERIAELMSEIWGGDTDWVSDSLAAERRDFPERLAVSLVEEETGGPALTASWVRFHPGTDFASLWGGSTRPQWRRQGLYRATLTHRARLARDRGFRYVRVDASEDSRPILQRLGLVQVATTTPYVFNPPA